jgi:NAD(P)-dependent dehydrogenase (short-subunit alcohol dehydrogenase family)
MTAIEARETVRRDIDATPTAAAETASSPLLADRVVLVTGGARGLGAAIGRALAARGARIVVADIDASNASATADALAATGAQAISLELDVRDEGACERVVAEVGERFGRLDVLVNNAGTDVTSPFDELTIADWDRVLDVNLRGPIVLTRAALPLLRQSDRGHIVNITSTAAKRAWENASAYHATKWGLLGFSHALHTECRREGIKVTAVVAGGMRTPFLLDRFPDLDPGLLQDPANVAEAVRFALELPAETVIPEVTVLPMRETSWP